MDWHPRNHHVSPCEASKMGFRHLWLLVLVLPSLIITANAAKVLMSQVLRGRVFGSETSSDIPKRILVGEDGALYVGGTTIPKSEGDPAWGHVDAGEVVGKSDIFVAKFSSMGQLVWVKRTGSTGDEELRDLKIANEALYVCGWTEGNFGAASRGGADAFIMKFTLDGDKAWRYPLQFGSSEDDSCNALEIDAAGQRVFAVGSTRGKLFGSLKPVNNSAQFFSASFEEFDDSVGLKLFVGRQNGSRGNSSSSAIAISGNHAFVMSTDWENQSAGKAYLHTHINVLDRETLLIHRRFRITGEGNNSFRGVRMVIVSETEDSYVIGESLHSNGTMSYNVLKITQTGNDSVDGVTWATRVGRRSTNASLLHQTPSLIVDDSAERVYVAGVEDGFFVERSSAEETSGVMIMPFIQIRSSTGVIEQCWHRTTSVPSEMEEITDIALDPANKVVYTGVWNGGYKFQSNVLIGSFGSTEHTSRRPGSIPVASVGFAQAGDEIERAKKESGRGKLVGYVLLGLGVGGVILTALILHGMRSSKRDVVLANSDESEGGIDMEEIRRQVAEAHRDSEILDNDVEGAVVGGSAAPR